MRKLIKVLRILANSFSIRIYHSGCLIRELSRQPFESDLLGQCSVNKFVRTKIGHVKRIRFKQLNPGKMRKSSLPYVVSSFDVHVLFDVKLASSTQ